MLGASGNGIYRNHLYLWSVHTAEAAIANLEYQAQWEIVTRYQDDRLRQATYEEVEKSKVVVPCNHYTNSCQIRGISQQGLEIAIGICGTKTVPPHCHPTSSDLLPLFVDSCHSVPNTLAEKAECVKRFGEPQICIDDAPQFIPENSNIQFNCRGTALYAPKQMSVTSDESLRINGSNFLGLAITVNGAVPGIADFSHLYGSNQIGRLCHVISEVINVTETMAITCWARAGTKLRSVTRVYHTDVATYVQARSRQTRQIDRPSFNLDQYLNYTITECRKSYEQDYLEPLKQICPLNLSSSSRRRRFDPITIGVVSIGGLALASAYNTYKVIQLSSREEELDQKVDMNFEVLARLVEEVGKSHQNLQEAVKTDQKKIQEVANDLYKLNATVDALLTLIPAFNAKYIYIWYMVMTVEMKAAGRLFKEAARARSEVGAVSPKLF